MLQIMMIILLLLKRGVLNNGNYCYECKSKDLTELYLEILEDDEELEDE